MYWICVIKGNIILQIIYVLVLSFNATDLIYLSWSLFERIRTKWGTKREFLKSVYIFLVSDWLVSPKTLLSWRPKSRPMSSGWALPLSWLQRGRPEGQLVQMLQIFTTSTFNTDNKRLWYVPLCEHYWFKVMVMIKRMAYLILCE